MRFASRKINSRIDRRITVRQKYEKLNAWYVSLNKKQRYILWGVSLPYAFVPLTGVLLGGIPWLLLLLFMEFHRGAARSSNE